MISGVLCSGCMDPSTASVHALCAKTATSAELLPIQDSAIYVYICNSFSLIIKLKLSTLVLNYSA